MAESPTPETGTPESQSPARTPPALVTTEELLQSMLVKSPEARTWRLESLPRESVLRRAPVERYEILRATDAVHKLQGLRMPPEEELRAAALGARPTVGTPPRLPHQLSPALQSVLSGWRSVYESCRTAPELQALVGECYAQEAVFEDALVSARGQEAVYRQFALLGAAVRSVQVAAYSLSVEPLSRPLVLLERPLGVGVRVGIGPSSSSGGPPVSKGPLPFPVVQQPGPQQPCPQISAGRTLSQQQQQQPSEMEAGTVAVRHQQQLHLTRVTVENVQCFELGLPLWLTWLVGSKASGLQVHLYVTSILLVVSDAPLAVDGGSGGSGGGLGPGGWPGDVTASRLAGAAAALGRNGGGGAAGMAEPTDCAGGAGGGDNGGAFPSWRIVHQVDIWHNVPMVWWRLRRALCVAIDALLAPLLLLLGA